MSEKRPEDQESVEAELVEEDVVEATVVPETPAPPPAAPEPSEPGPLDATEAPKPAPRPAYRGYRPPRRKTGLGFGPMLFLLALVVVAAWLWRTELADTYDAMMDRFLGAPRQEAAEGPEDVIVEATPGTEPEPTTPRPRPKETVAETPLPTFEERTIPQLPAETIPTLPPTEKTPGLALGILERRDLSVEGISQFEYSVLVPADYDEKDLRRMAENVVTGERKRGVCHAVRLYCFKDRKSTNPEDAFAEVIWAPRGNFFRAREALRTGVDDNQYRIIMK